MYREVPALVSVQSTGISSPKFYSHLVSLYGKDLPTSPSKVQLISSWNCFSFGGSWLMHQEVQRHTSVKFFSLSTAKTFIGSFWDI